MTKFLCLRVPLDVVGQVENAAADGETEDSGKDFLCTVAEAVNESVAILSVIRCNVSVFD